MKRQEFLLNLTLLVIIGALVYLIYDYKESVPSGLDDLDEQISMAASSETSGSRKPAAPNGRNGAGKPAIPGKETSYATGDKEGSADNGDEDKDDKDNGNEKADSPAGGPDKFGETNIFRALLTPTPTPTPPPTPPPPTPDIGKVLGPWKLLSVYNGKAMIEDIGMSAKGEEGAIFELAPGQTKQVDSGGGSMKTATLKAIDSSNPYNPEIVLSLEGTENERKINLDTEPAAAAPAPAAGQPKPQ